MMQTAENWNGNDNIAGNKREVCSKLVIVVMDQKAWSLLKRGGIAPLLRDPGISWLPGDIDMHYPPRFQFDDHENDRFSNLIELPEQRVLNGFTT
jgi:hypothetical protein